jgi:hypothetical protein
MDVTNAVLQAFDRTANAFIPIYINSSQTIIPTGNVLIGTTTDAGYKLDVNGTGKFSGALQVASNITAVNGAMEFGGSGSAPSTDPAIYRVGGVNSLAFAIGSIPRLTIASTGAATFSSSVTASSYITSLINVGFVNTNASQAGFVADYTGTGALKVSFSTYNDFMNIYNETNGYSIINFTRSTKNIAINPTGGNVGIGIAVPSYKLDVYSSTTATQAIANFAAANYGSPSSRTIIQIGTQYEDGSSRIASVNTTGNQSALIFQSHAATSGVWNDAMYINGSGNVGIGTDSPSTRLDVRNAGAVTLSVRADGITGDSVARLQHDAIIRSTWTANRTTSQVVLAALGTFPLAFHTNGVERINITTGGNVLIGTSTTPTPVSGVAFPLTVSSSAATRLRIDSTNASPNSGVGLYANGVQKFSFAMYGTDSDFTIYNDALLAPALTVKGTNSNVLIGTTADNANKLRVNGVGFFDQGIRTGNPYGSTTNNVLIGRFLTETASVNGSIRVQIGTRYYNIAAQDLGEVPS